MGCDLMRSYLLYKITHIFHRLGFYYYSVKFYVQDNKENNNIILCFFKAVFRYLKIFNYKYGYYEYLEIPITTKCSLRCKHCSNLIPFYKKQSDYEISVLEKSIKEFLKCINNIVFVRVLGGEPFLGGNIIRVLQILLKSDKIQRIEVVTNGTIIPKDKKLIKLLKNPRVVISISQYPFVNYHKLEEFLIKEEIKYHIDKMTFWLDFGDAKKQNKTVKQLARQYRNCNQICRSLVNGQFHLCPRSSHGTDLGIVKDNEDDYLDLLDSTMTIEEKRNRINQLLKKKYIKACDHCYFGTRLAKKVPVAEQINKKVKNQK